ncbi:MAG: Fic family protein [Gemmatimonadaceae bacterium]|nr:Fic family protein [Gemmatimonadaceae bacterium]
MPRPLSTPRSTGRFVLTTAVGNEAVRAFVPNPLPPTPPVDIDGALRHRLDRAHVMLGRLDALTSLLVDPRLFLDSYVRREAVLSSQIEGTQSSLSDLLVFEADGADDPSDDVLEVSNYVAATAHGMARLREGFPLSLRLIREMHALVLASGRGASKQPGEFRRTQNWIGGARPGTARFVPPPPAELSPCLDALERWLHEPADRVPPLIKAALAHVQFETIHPFLDGNGRVGRLLIVVSLCADGLLREPLLYLSLYFKRHRSLYYELLTAVREEGDWERWLRFFVDGVEETATDAVQRAERILERFAIDRVRVAQIPRGGESTVQAYRALQGRPVHSVASMARALDMSIPAATRALDKLGNAGLVAEITGRRRDRLFAYTSYLELLRTDTDDPFPT